MNEDQSSLQNEAVHTDNRPFTCTICKKKFAHETTLLQHNQRKHPKLSKYQACSICEKLFTKSNLNSHLHVQSDVKAHIHCMTCETIFTCNLLFQSHTCSISSLDLGPTSKSIDVLNNVPEDTVTGAIDTDFNNIKKEQDVDLLENNMETDVQTYAFQFKEELD